MSRVKIEDLPLLDELSESEVLAVTGGRALGGAMQSAVPYGREWLNANQTLTPQLGSSLAPYQQVQRLSLDLSTLVRGQLWQHSLVRASPFLR